MKPDRKKGDILAGLFFIFMGIGTIWEALKLQLGTASKPQPGFFPFLGGFFLIAFSAILVIRAMQGKSTGGKRFKVLGPPAIMVVTLYIYISILNFVGYCIATIPLSMVVLRVLDTKKWSVLLSRSVILSVITYFLFKKLLEVPLPNGILTPFF